jgi:hypothetical protein
MFSLKGENLTSLRSIFTSLAKQKNKKQEQRKFGIKFDQLK